jgi:predicted aspartyl protease
LTASQRLNLMTRMFAPRLVRLLYWLSLTGFVIPAGARQSDCLTGDSTVFASPTRKDHVGRILAPVMINGQGPFRFIVDTGASHSTVSPALASLLRLDVADESPILVNGITGTALVPSVQIDRLEAGALSLENTRFPVIWAPLMAGADGILGVAGLKKERIFVEFTRNRVCLSRSNSMHTPLGFVSIPAVRLESGLMTVNARVSGIRARAVIDTGAERSLGNIALRDALERVGTARNKTNTTDVFGSTDAIVRGEIGTAPMIALGPIKIANVDLIYGDFHIFDVWKMQDRPALIIGMDVLGSVRSLVIDFRNQELYLEGVYFYTRPDSRAP